MLSNNIVSASPRSDTRYNPRQVGAMVATPSHRTGRGDYATNLSNFNTRMQSLLLESFPPVADYPNDREVFTSPKYGTLDFGSPASTRQARGRLPHKPCMTLQLPSAASCSLIASPMVSPADSDATDLDLHPPSITCSLSLNDLHAYDALSGGTDTIKQKRKSRNRGRGNKNRPSRVARNLRRRAERKAAIAHAAGAAKIAAKVAASHDVKRPMASTREATSRRAPSSTLPRATSQSFAGPSNGNTGRAPPTRPRADIMAEALAAAEALIKEVAASLEHSKKAGGVIAGASSRT